MGLKFLTAITNQFTDIQTEGRAAPKVTNGSAFLWAFKLL